MEPQEEYGNENDDYIDFKSLNLEIKIRLLEYYLENNNVNKQKIEKIKNCMFIKHIIKDLKKGKIDEDNIILEDNKINKIHGICMVSGLFVMDDKELYKTKKKNKYIFKQKQPSKLNTS